MCLQRKVILTAAMAASLLFIGPATSQEADREGWWFNWGMGRMMSDDGPPIGMGWWGYGDQIDRIDGRLAYLKTELRIDEKQAAAWEGFADAVKTSVESHNDMMRDMWGGQDDDISSSDRLDRHISLMEARLAQMKALKSASDQLYSVLSDEQKRTADEILLPMMEPGPHGMGRWMMRG